MTATHAPDFIKLLANDLRWNILKALAVSDFQVNELVEQVHEPMNLVSYHLKKMRDDALVTTRRSEADARDVYYTLDLAQVKTFYQDAARALHPALSFHSFQPEKPLLAPMRVLFVCTHNSARSQMAEGLLRHHSGNQFTVFSAGSYPTQIHPDAIATMDALGIDIRRQQVRNISEFEEQNFDYVITVCDKAREVCPTFSGNGFQLHWGFADPVAIKAKAARTQAFREIAARLNARTEYFIQSL